MLATDDRGKCLIPARSHRARVLLKYVHQHGRAIISSRLLLPDNHARGLALIRSCVRHYARTGPEPCSCRSLSLLRDRALVHGHSLETSLGGARRASGGETANSIICTYWMCIGPHGPGSRFKRNPRDLSFFPLPLFLPQRPYMYLHVPTCSIAPSLIASVLCTVTRPRSCISKLTSVS